VWEVFNDVYNVFEEVVWVSVWGLEYKIGNYNNNNSW